MFPMSDNVKTVGDAGLFASCPLAERQVLASLAIPMRVAAGEDVVGQGDFGSTIGVLLEGRASVWLDDAHIADLVAGDCFGELAVLSNPSASGRRTARVRADSEVRVDTVSQRDLNQNLGEIPSIADKLREQAASYGDA